MNPENVIPDPIIEAAVAVGEAQAKAEERLDDAVSVAAGHSANAAESAANAKDAVREALEPFQHVPTLEEIHATAAEGSRKGAHEVLGEWEARQNERLAALERRMDEFLTGDVVKARDKETAAEPEGPVAVADEGQEVIQGGTEEVLDVATPPAARPAPKAKGKYYRI